MENLVPISTSWWNLLLLALALAAVQVGIRFLQRLLDLSNTFRSVRGPVRSFLRIARVMFEPVATFLLAFVFVLINHLEHGALIVLAVVVSFPHLRNYVSGRLLMLENTLQEGDEIKFGSLTGKVRQLGRMGLKLRNPEGLIHINYKTLFTEGYTRLSSASSGEYVTLEIWHESEPESRSESKPEGTHSANNDKQRIAIVLASAPYVDWHLRPHLEQIGEKASNFRARVQLKKEAHLKDLIELLREKGFLSKIIYGQTVD